MCTGHNKYSQLFSRRRKQRQKGHEKEKIKAKAKLITCDCTHTGHAHSDDCLPPAAGSPRGGGAGALFLATPTRPPKRKTKRPPVVVAGQSGGPFQSPGLSVVCWSRAPTCQTTHASAQHRGCAGAVQAFAVKTRRARAPNPCPFMLATCDDVVLVCGRPRGMARSHSHPPLPGEKVREIKKHKVVCVVCNGLGTCFLFFEERARTQTAWRARSLALCGNLAVDGGARKRGRASSLLRTPVRRGVRVANLPASTGIALSLSAQTPTNQSVNQWRTAPIVAVSPHCRLLFQGCAALAPRTQGPRTQGVGALARR